MSMFNLLGAGLSAAGGVGLANQLTQTGNDAKREMGQLAGGLQNDTLFQGYGVTTPLGTSTVNPNGTTNFGTQLDQSMQGLADSSLGYSNDFQNFAMQAANNSMQNPYAREQDVYNRAMAIQNPMLDEMQAQQQAREFAMGRGGVRGSLFGGTAEDAAMAKARANASNAAAFQAMTQAQNEMMNQGNLANIYGNLGNQTAVTGMNAFGQSFLPLQQQMNAMQVAQNNANLAQTGQLTGAGYAAQLGLGGIQSDINAQMAATQLYGNLFDSLMDNSGAIGEGAQGLWDAITGWF